MTLCRRPELRRALRPVVDDYKKLLAGLPELLDSAGGTMRLPHLTTVLRELLHRPDSAQAAWRDLVTAVTAGKAEEQNRLHALQLREIEESLGHQWAWRRTALCKAVDEAVKGQTVAQSPTICSNQLAAC